MSRDRYDKLINKISKRLGTLVAQYHAGHLTSEDERLLARCILGEASDAERELATHLVDTAQGVALLCSVRHAIRGVAITTPVPAAAPPSMREQVIAVFAQAKNTVGSIAGRGGGSSGDTATNAVVSGSSGNASRIAAGIAACVIGVGGTATCVVTGTTPTSLVTMLPGQGEDTPVNPPKTTEEPPPQTVATPAPSTSTTPASTGTEPAEPPPEDDPVEPSPPDDPPAAAKEFLIERQEAVPSQSTQPSKSSSSSGSEFSASQPAPAPSPGGGGSGGEFSFEGGG